MYEWRQFCVGDSQEDNNESFRCFYTCYRVHRKDFVYASINTYLQWCDGNLAWVGILCHQGERGWDSRAWERSRLSTVADDPRDSQGKSVFWFFNMEHWGCLIPRSLAITFWGLLELFIKENGDERSDWIGRKSEAFPFLSFSFPLLPARASCLSRP